MQKYIEVSGKSEEEAVANALRQLGLPREDVSIELVERAKSGFLGIGASPAIIKVYYDGPDESLDEKKTAEPVKAPEQDKDHGQDRSAITTSAAAEKAHSFLDGLLEHMDTKANININEKEDGSIFIELSGDSMGAVIGRRGETLDAIQHLTNYAVNRGAEERIRISIDAENYRAKREEALVRLAEKMAAKALKYKRSMALEPMNSYERHVIHTALQSYEGVTTSSTGTEPNRRVVISCEKPTDNHSRYN